ncbi:ATP-dependent zinc metalloprotease FtsH [Bacillota bacterium Meth-B3]|nr:ATP-dependent zinc metalloprotease FtsH [Christensenellaceae bacterium]
MNNNNKPFKPPTNRWIYIAIAIAVMMALNYYAMSSMMSPEVKTVEYSDFADMVAKGQVETAEIGASIIKFTGKAMGQWMPTRYQTNAVNDPNLVERLLHGGVRFGGEDPRSFSLLGLLGVLMQLAMSGLLIFMLVRMLRGTGGGIGAMGLGKSGAKLYELNESRKMFSDVAGQDEAKEALSELVDFLHQPEKYKSIGAKLPKGALLVGPPGTGKTLIAQAVAGEARVPFFFVSGSAFVEMFVGQGAARVRDLFKQAGDKAPCIVFIDEIDAIGKKRDTIGISANDEREQALNQLLAEMDGFDPNKGIVVLGATNRPEILDKALLRPGRFDRRITVDLPDLKGREAVLRVHARPITLAADVDLFTVAKATVGASGADLANIMNEAALRAVRVKHKAVEQNDLEAAVDTVIAGSERKSLVVPEKERRMIAAHEIGHALVAARQKHAAPVTKITIIPRTSGALGYTMQVDEDEHVINSREDLLARLRVYAAGRAAEEFAFGTSTTGAANDIEQMTKLARAMITRFGMSDEFGMMALETGAGQYLNTEGQMSCSSDTAARVDHEVALLVKQAYEDATRILKENSQKLYELSSVLLEKETLLGDEFMEILNRPAPEAPVEPEA